MPGMATSRIRHLVWSTQSDERNSSADANAWTTKPSSFSKSGSDSRTDSSSSTTVTSTPTTETNERVTIMDSSPATARAGHQAPEGRSEWGRSWQLQVCTGLKMKTWLRGRRSVLPRDGHDEYR